MKIEKKIIEELVGYLKEFNLTEIEYAEGTKKVKVSRSLNISNTVNTNTQIEHSKNKVKENGNHVASPIVGTAYLASEPGAKKFVEVGDKIKKGQTVMIVEAMKTMNHVPSSADGTVKKIMVNDGQPVEFGQTLIILN